MKYLGVLFNIEGSCEEEIENRIGAAVKVIGAMRSEVLERRAEQVSEAESIQCNGGSYVTIWMRNLDHTEAP